MSGRSRRRLDLALLFVAGVAQVSAALLLVYSAATKFALPRDITSTLRALRIPRPRIARLVLATLELGTGVGLAVTPNARGVRLSVLLLAVLFTGAGGLAIARGDRIECACFGGGRGSTLGVRQLLLLPAWLLLFSMLALVDLGLDGRDGLLVLAGATLAVASVQGALVSRTRQVNRSYRATLVRA